SQIENSYTSGCRHSICGYSIEDSCFYHPVSDCIEGEKRIVLHMRDINEPGISYELILHKRIINLQEALNVRLGGSYTQASFKEDETLPISTINLEGDLIFLKVE
ncbi:hypothetical protein, partial [Gangjinia marincola]|uniref:hypothetical protein n=1 Tax=Gangjinia marincola TaxID=578463 RepID=UPI0031CE768D